MARERNIFVSGRCQPAVRFGIRKNHKTRHPLKVAQASWRVCIMHGEIASRRAICNASESLEPHKICAEITLTSLDGMACTADNWFGHSLAIQSAMQMATNDASRCFCGSAANKPRGASSSWVPVFGPTALSALRNEGLALTLTGLLHPGLPNGSVGIGNESVSSRPRPARLSFET
jgi:hypothetical protein